MRRFFAVSLLGVLIVISRVAGAEVQADFSNSYADVQNSQTLRIRNISNVVQDGVPLSGEFWADVVWDPQSFSFKPNGNVGQEQLPTGLNQYDGTYTGNWSLTCPGCNDNAAGSFTATLIDGVFTGIGLPIESGTHGPRFDSGAVSASGAITGTGATPNQCGNSASTFVGEIVIAPAGTAGMTITYSRPASAGGCEAEFGTITATRTPSP